MICAMHSIIDFVLATISFGCEPTSDIRGNHQQFPSSWIPTYLINDITQFPSFVCWLI